jgi:hypothetical protein
VTEDESRNYEPAPCGKQQKAEHGHDHNGEPSPTGFQSRVGKLFQVSPLVKERGCAAAAVGRRSVLHVDVKVEQLVGMMTRLQVEEMMEMYRHWKD